ncbi:MAG: hypothetical protein CMO35_03645 [Verrucomicrobiaceae bacterium]|nr:hypothetical protein [Verrucomicrobiaceae bacterium]
MNRSFLNLLLLLLPLPLEAGQGVSLQKEAIRPFLENHCFHCHGPEKQKGKIRLDTLSPSITSNETAENWQQVLDALNAGEMPPKDEPQPDPGAKADFLETLATAMVDARRYLADRGSAITMRRLNRREYANSLRDLLGSKINVSELPTDMSSTAFDTSSSSLIMSSDQFEQYLALGREALKEAFARQENRGIGFSRRMEAEDGNLERIRRNLHKRMEGHQRYTRWKGRIDDLARLPENRNAVARMRELNKGRPKHDFHHWWRELPGAPDPKDYGFTDGNHATHVGVGQWNTIPHLTWYISQPENDTGAWLSIGDNAVLPWYTFQANAPAGDYLIRIQVGANPDVNPQRKFVEFGRRSQGFVHLSTHEIRGTVEEPQVIEIPVTHTVGGDRVFFLRERGTFDSGHQSAFKFNRGKQENGIAPDYALWVDWSEVVQLPESEFVTPPGLMALKDAEENLRDALQRFAVEACRGKELPDSFVDRLIGVYKMNRNAGRDPQEALVETVAVILASPRFLYLSEPGEGNLPPMELASRLSFFLQGTLPDSTLRELAENGNLTKPEILAAQTDRLVNEPEFLTDFVEPFAHQWLDMERLDFFEFDHQRYPDFDKSTKEAARQEVSESIVHVIRENLGLTNLLHADYVVVNSLLANYYGIVGVEGDEFRPVGIPDDSPRGGLLGMAAVHAMGSNGVESNPVERGVWILRKLLNDPPPPAPANVPQITRLSDQLLTTRERLAIHQKEAQCSSCHRKIDPIGFGLENFDAAGRWRTKDHYEHRNQRKSWTIDASGKFHNGPAFADFFELRNQIGSRKEDFAMGFAEALVSYALGRPAGFSDRELIKQMVERAKKKDYRAREFFHVLIQSSAFQSKPRNR